MPARLNPIDALFLSEETRTTPRQVTTLAVLEPGPDGFDYDRLVRVISERIALVPRYRQRVMSVPGHVGAPVWVDDEDFDLTYHVRRSALPSPGTSESLRDLVSRLISRRLDLDKPLWEAYLVEGLEHGRVALLIKSHQALVDGSETVDLAQVLLEETTRDRDVPHDGWTPRAAPSPFTLVADSLTDLATHPTKAAGLAGALLGRAASLLPVLGPPRADHDHLLTGELSQHRRFVTVATRLEDYRRVRDAHGGTVNDVILATIASAVRAWLLTRAEPVADTMRLRAMVPMSVVSPDGAPTSLGSKVRGHLLTLPVGESNPVVRLHQVSYALKAHRETGVAVAANTLAGLPGFAPTTFHAVGARVADSASGRSFQLVITNVPGPQEPMYMAGARVAETYPALPLAHDRLLSIGVTSYDGGVYFGLVADRQAIPDADVLGQCISEALDELVESTSPTRQRAPRGRKRPAAKS
ncbi:MAG: wax ester/triacylglycerol synthase family O-acyltransferase [Nocardioidaceae bacterium]|nr:wax ester/triacylglycerol synthase family O-acyltransferase [Nocardioidaceae bacterium]